MTASQEQDMTREDFSEMMEEVRQVIRAKLGLGPEDDVFKFLLNMKDSREKARNSEHDFYGHSGMRIIAAEFPDEMDFWADMADMEDVYSISIDGEGRKESILMANAHKQEQMPLTVQLPAVTTTPQVQTEKKKRWYKP